MKCFFVGVLFIMMTGISGCTDNIVAPDAAVLGETQEGSAKMAAVPFKLEMELTVTPTFAPGFPLGLSTFDGRCSVPSTWVLSYTAEGLASHMGVVTGHGSHCAVVVWGAGGAVVGGSGSDAIMTIVAANGDQIELDRVGTGNGVLDNGAPWWAEEWSVLAGTGRFEGASGAGTLFGVFAGFTTTSPVTMAGTLSY